jgi:hypothetical protein
MSVASRWAPLLLLPVLGGCGSLHAPRGVLPKPAAAQQEAFGGWAIIRTAGAVGGQVEGELIAVSADTVWLFQNAALLAVPAAAILQAQVSGYDSSPGTIVGVAALGVLATLSNGGFLILTAPAWLLTGTLGSHAQARYSRMVAQRAALDALSLYARFPQGMPPGLDRGSLLPRGSLSAGAGSRRR